MHIPSLPLFAFPVFTEPSSTCSTFFPLLLLAVIRIGPPCYPHGRYFPIRRSQQHMGSVTPSFPCVRFRWEALLS